MSTFWEETLSIWLAGGPLMLPLAGIAFSLFYAETRLLLHLKTHPLLRHPGNDPALREWEASLQRNARDGRDIGAGFANARQATLRPVDRRIRFYAILVGVCPLLGLLGTVSGMTSTFQGMGRPGVSNLSSEVAAGVSQALVTTQTGLLIAIPGMILLSVLRRDRDRIALSLFERESILLHSVSVNRP